MSKRDIGQEILDGIREIKAFKAGQGGLRTHALKETRTTSGDSRQTEIIPVGFCRFDGSQLTNRSRLGARPA